MLADIIKLDLHIVAEAATTKQVLPIIVAEVIPKELAIPAQEQLLALIMALLALIP